MGQFFGALACLLIAMPVLLPVMLVIPVWETWWLLPLWTWCLMPLGVPAITFGQLLTFDILVSCMFMVIPSADRDGAMITLAVRLITAPYGYYAIAVLRWTGWI